MEQKLKKVFSQVLNIPVDQVNDRLTNSSVSDWDSVTHMSLVSAIDEAFEISLPFDDIIGLTGFKKAVEILIKHGVENTSS